MSAAALAGFFAALVIHGYLRSDSGIIDGLNAIYYQDVLRRTFGDAKNFSSFFAESLNSSVFHVLWLYLKKKPTGIIALALLIMSIISCVTAKRHNLPIKRDIISFLTSISWFVLAKGYSYVHTFIYGVICLSESKNYDNYSRQ